MTAHVRKALRFGLAALVFLSLGGCAPPIYFAKATHGTVVDAETKQPIAGAVIVANWDLLYELSGEDSHGVRSMQITEVVTDKQGNYVVPGWGPKLRPCFTYLDNHDPVLSVFKSGYVPEGWMNDRDSNSWVRVSEWDGRALELKPFRGTPRYRWNRLSSFMINCRHHTRPLKAMYEEIIKDVDSADHADILRGDARQLLLPNQ